MPIGDLFGKGRRDDYDALDSLNEVDVSREVAFSGARAWIVFHALSGDKDSLKVVDEHLAKGNIVVLDIEYMSREGQDSLNRAIDEIRERAASINGDIARISADKVIVTPRGVKIMRKRL